MQPDRYYLTAQQAAEALGVSKPTLYAYTSRGLLHSESIPDQPRERRYHRDAVERYRERKDARRDPAKAAARGLHWGSPVLDSGITLVQNGRFYYRGRDAVRLAETATLEEVAQFLWGAEPAETSRLFAQPHPSRRLAARLKISSKNPITLLQAALPIAGAVDMQSYDLRPAAVRLTGARILRLLASIVAGRDSPAPIHALLQSSWRLKKHAAGQAIRAALVLCADHELNVSTFAARCAASASASPYDVVAAALATLKGSRHGGATERVSALFAEAARRPAADMLADRLRQGEILPGFGHPLYPAGDPRAALLMRLAKSSGNEKSGGWFGASRGPAPNCCTICRTSISRWLHWRAVTDCRNTLPCFCSHWAGPPAGSHTPSSSTPPAI